MNGSNAMGYNTFTRCQSLGFVVAVNDEMVLRSSLLGSPELISGGFEISVQRGADSAARAYNRGIETTQSDMLVFVHQDVYLPNGWLDDVRAVIGRVASMDPNWGVLGVFGVTAQGMGSGWLYSTGLGRVLGGPFPDPQVVRTLDEVLLVIRRSSGLRFDPNIPGFHMYGTDLCLQAESRGLRSYVMPCFLVHNSNGIKRLPKAFWLAYLAVRRKWGERLPIHAPCAVVTRFPASAIKMLLGSWFRQLVRGQATGVRVADPGALYQQLVRDGALGLGTRAGGPTNAEPAQAPRTSGCDRTPTSIRQ
ncbi:MAG: glycosyltransferase [Limisphaerales bacterium]